MRRGDARALVASFLASVPGGGWLPPEQVSALLACYRIPLVPTRQVADVEQALAAAGELGGRVVLKADVPGVLHKTDAGALALDLRAPGEIRAVFRRFTDVFAERLRGVLVQPMVIGGVEVIIGVVQDPVFGPVVVFGPGGVATEVLGEHSARLTPLSGADTDDLIHQSRAGQLVLGRRPNPTATSRPCATPCCASPNSPMMYPKWRSSISTRSLSAPTASSRSTRASGSLLGTPPILSSETCASSGKRRRTASSGEGNGGAWDGGGELPVGQVPADGVDHCGVVGQAVGVDSACDLRAVVRHAGRVRPCECVPRAACAGRAGGQDSDGASGPSSYEVTSARPAACVVTSRVDRQIPNRTVEMSVSGWLQTRPRRHHVHHHCQWIFPWLVRLRSACGA